MNDSDEFLILRYSLVEEPQGSMDVKPVPTPKGAAILIAVEGDREFVLNGVKYSFVGFHSVAPNEYDHYDSGRYFIGKVAKLKKAHMGKKVPGDILETHEDDWYPLLLIIDIVTQHIFAQKDWRFGTPEQIVSSIQSGLREPVLSAYNHRVFVEGRTNTEHFWKIVSSAKRVYKLQLRLISPNILETNLAARDALAALKDIFSQDEVDVTLENESGELRIPRNPVGQYLEYIEEGEGAWAITTDGAHGGKKKHTSNQNIETIDLSLPSGIVHDAQQLELLGDNVAVNEIKAESEVISQIHSHMNNQRVA